MSLQALMIQQALARPDVRQVLAWAAQHVRGCTFTDPTQQAALQLLQQAGFLSTTGTATTSGPAAAAG